MNDSIYLVYKKFMTWVGDVMVATKPPATKAQHILQMMDVIQTGDIICRYYTYYLDSLLIPGEFTHSGIVISKDEMAHSISEGVQSIHPIDFVKDTDGFIVLRPYYANDVAKEKVIAKALWHVKNNTPYDFTFSDPSKFYCHEFTVDCLKAGGITNIEPMNKSFGIFPFKFTKIVYLADSIIHHCKIVYLFKG